MSTDALVTTLTSALQLGNGSRKSSPMTVETSTPNTGTLVRWLRLSNMLGM